MNTTKSEATREQEFSALAAAMHVRLRQWRAEHPEASFDEIGEQVTRERQQLMGVLMAELVAQPEEVLSPAPHCPDCGQVLTPKGKQARGVSHLEGEVRVVREYHYCGACGSGIFPPGRTIEADATCVESGDARRGDPTWGGNPVV
jgi:hypothetical protein